MTFNQRLVSDCSKLPEDWTGVFTNTEFPVDNGATITVYCQEDYVKVGSSVVTCNTDLRENSYINNETKPSCIRAGE